MYPRLDDVPRRAAVATYHVDYQHVYGLEPMGEFVLAAVLDWNYRLRERSATFSACAWGDGAPAGCPTTKQLTSHPTAMGQTLGVIGYGSIGKAVAQRSAAIGMRTIATKVRGPFVPAPEPLAWLGDDNDWLLRESDFVVTTLPGSVHGVINRTSLALMKPGAVLIPLASGHVNFDELHEALSRRAIGGAVLDVWPSGCWRFPDMECGKPYGPAAEPYARQQIQKLDNVVALPGVAMRDGRFWKASAAYVAENLRALLGGKALQGVVRNSTMALAEERRAQLPAAAVAV